MEHLPPTDDELHAFVDDELSDARRAAVENWLAAHPEDSARVQAWKKQAELIQMRYGGLVNEPVTPRFDLDRLVRADPPWRLMIASAAVFALLIGGAAGWFGRGAWDGAPAAKLITAEALDAHKLYVVEVRHPVEVPGSEAPHLVQWLSRRVGHELRAPELQSLGLQLVGGRLLPGSRGAAAFFMYEGQSGERFTIYCSRSGAPDTALRYRPAGSLAAFYWTENDFSYVVSGTADRTRLQRVAETAYEQLEIRLPTNKNSEKRGAALAR
jgi:anti-sigma factor RsiW